MVNRSFFIAFFNPNYDLLDISVKLQQPNFLSALFYLFQRDLFSAPPMLSTESLQLSPPQRWKHNCRPGEADVVAHLGSNKSTIVIPTNHLIIWYRRNLHRPHSHPPISQSAQHTTLAPCRGSHLPTPPEMQPAQQSPADASSCSPTPPNQIQSDA